MKHPMQPIVKTANGIIRFRQNDIIDRLWREGAIDLNKIACWGGISDDDMMQLAQLLGYSVGGYCDLSYASEESKDAACAIADAIVAGVPVVSNAEGIAELEDKLAIEREHFEVTYALRVLTADISGAYCASLVAFGDKDGRLLIQGTRSGKSIVLAQMVRTSDRWFPAELSDGELRRQFTNGASLITAVFAFMDKHANELIEFAKAEQAAFELVLEQGAAEAKASAAAKLEDDARNEAREESGT